MPNEAESKMQGLPYEQMALHYRCLFSRVQALLIDNAGILLLHRPPTKWVRVQTSLRVREHMDTLPRLAGKAAA